MITNIKFYLLAAFFVAALVAGGIVIFNQHTKIQAQAEAFEIFEKESENQRAEIFVKIDSLKETDQAQDEIIKDAQGDRARYEAELNDLKQKYEKTNFNNFSNDSLAGYFSNRRRQR